MTTPYSERRLAIESALTDEEIQWVNWIIGEERTEAYHEGYSEGYDDGMDECLE